MHWVLAGCCGLVLISLSVCSVAENKTQLIYQKPRYYGVVAGAKLRIYCQLLNADSSYEVKWLKASKDNPNKKHDITDTSIDYVNKGNDIKAFLLINQTKPTDSGIYYCKTKGMTGPGTEVTIYTTGAAPDKAQYRTNVKDGLIVFQGLLLAVCIAALLLRKQKLLEQSDSMYEEPETDHIYEGLAIETCSGGLYEELSVYAQAEGAEAPWE